MSSPWRLVAGEVRGERTLGIDEVVGGATRSWVDERDVDERWSKERQDEDRDRGDQEARETDTRRTPDEDDEEALDLTQVDGQPRRGSPRCRGDDHHEDEHAAGDDLRVTTTRRSSSSFRLKVRHVARADRAPRTEQHAEDQDGDTHAADENRSEGPPRATNTQTPTETKRMRTEDHPKSEIKQQEAQLAGRCFGARRPCAAAAALGSTARRGSTF